MTLKELKTQIENKSLSSTFVIFKSNESFIPNQYIRAINDILNLDVEYIEDLYSLGSTKVDIFFNALSNTNSLRVHHTDNLTFNNNSLLTETNLIIVTKKVDKDTEKIYKDYIVEVDVLEHWCIKDYLYSILEGLDTKYIDWLMLNCNYDINRLQLEAEKILIFPTNERNIVFNQMLEDDAFMDISSKTIFDFTDAIVKKDINRLLTIYDEIDNIDIEAIGVVTVLYQNFRKLLQVWMSKNPTTESTGLSSKQIYAINKLPRIWSEQDLVKILQLLSSIDFKVKSGTMPVNILRDYLVVNILAR